jgi:hypothetical protein
MPLLFDYISLSSSQTLTATMHEDFEVQHLEAF